LIGFYRAGAEALSDAELVSLLMDRTVPHSRMLVRDGLPAFARVAWTQSRQPVTKRQAARVIVSLELGRRLASITDDREPLSDPLALGHRLIARYGHHVQERLGAVYLDSKHLMLREREIYIGTLNSAIVSTRDVLRFALDDHAASLIVFHNHPSGDPAPSAEDLLFTRKTRRSREGPRHRCARSPDLGCEPVRLAEATRRDVILNRAAFAALFFCVANSP
jgi:DNA repair protein RadC